MGKNIGTGGRVWGKNVGSVCIIDRGVPPTHRFYYNLQKKMVNNHIIHQLTANLYEVDLVFVVVFLLFPLDEPVQVCHGQSLERITFGFIQETVL